MLSAYYTVLGVTQINFKEVSFWWWLAKQAWNPQNSQGGKITSKPELQGQELNFKRASIFEKTSNWLS